jgi:cyanophycinase
MEYNHIENSCPVPQGILVIIGGKEDKGDRPETKMKTGGDLKSFCTAYRKRRALVEVVTSGSSEGEQMFEDYRKVFEQLNFKNIGHIHHQKRKEVLEDDLAQRWRMADAFFFKVATSDAYFPIRWQVIFSTLLKQRYISTKLVVGGTSAGAMALSTPMIYAGSDDKEKINGEIKSRRGLNF